MWLVPSKPTPTMILGVVRVAAAPGTRVVVAESFVERNAPDTFGPLADVQMMAACSGGRERSRAELERLVANAGFRPTRMFGFPTISLLEAIAT
jgi:hypothetical protein